MEKRSQPCEDKGKEHSRRNSLGAEGPRLKQTWSTHQHLNLWSPTLPVSRGEGYRGHMPAFLCISSKVMHVSAQSTVARTSHTALPICRGSGTPGVTWLLSKKRSCKGNPLSLNISGQKLLPGKPLLNMLVRGGISWMFSFKFYY